MLYSRAVTEPRTDPEPNEAALLAGVRALDGRALGRVHDAYYPEIYRYAFYRLGEAEAAADVAGEVFVRLLEAAHQGRAPRTTLRGWLFGVAANLVADHFRRRPTAPLAEELPGPHSVSAEVENRLQRGAVQAALRRLTPEQQQVLALRFGDGFSVETTAQTLGKSVTAVKALQFRALEALRRLVAPQVQDD
jgi:RNA polymerase sigma-70 factor (ECF subfamily)